MCQEATDHDRYEVVRTLVGAARRCRYVGLDFPAWLIGLAIADIKTGKPTPRPQSRKSRKTASELAELFREAVQ